MLSLQFFSFYSPSATETGVWFDFNYLCGEVWKMLIKKIKDV